MINANQFRIEFTLKKNASESITSIVFAIDYNTVLLVNPLFTSSAPGASASLTTNALGTTVTCSFTNQSVGSHDIGYMILSFVLSSDANNLQNDGHTSYLPYYGNAVGLTHVNGASIVTNNSPVVGDRELIVAENIAVDNADLGITLEKEDDDIEYSEVDIWTGNLGIAVNGINANPTGTIVTEAIISDPDPEGQFDVGMSNLVTNTSADLTGTSISLGSFSLQTNFLNRNAYRTSIRKIKYKDTPEKVLNTIGFNKNSSFKSTSSLYTVVDAENATVSVYMKKDMFAIHRYVIRLYLIDLLDLQLGQFTDPSSPFISAFFGYQMLASQGPRGIWAEHKQFIITMDAYTNQWNIYLNGHDVFMFSFPMVTVGNVRRTNDLFDVSLEEVRYHYNQFASPYIITTVGVKNVVDPPHSPVLFLSNNCANVGNIVEFPVIVNKWSGEAGRGFVIKMIITTAKFTSAYLSDLNILAQYRTIAIDYSGPNTMTTVTYDDPTSTTFLMNASTQVFQFNAVAVNVNTIGNDDIALIFESYTPYNPLLPMTPETVPTNFTLTLVDEYADTHTLLTQFNYHISGASFNGDQLMSIRQAQDLAQNFSIRNVSDNLNNFIPDTINNEDALFFQKSGVWANVGSTYNSGLFGTREELSLDAISCTVFRFSTQRTSWAKLCALGRDGALFGISQFSGQDKLVIRFDTASHGGDGQYIDINFSQSQSPLNYLAFASVEQKTTDTFDINFQLWSFDATVESKIKIAEKIFTITDTSISGGNTNSPDVHIGQDNYGRDSSNKLIIGESEFHIGNMTQGVRETYIRDKIAYWCE